MREGNTAPSRSANRGRCHTLSAATVGLTLLAALASPATAEIYSDTHEFFFDVENPTWDTTFQIPFDLPLFDDAGGARTLLGYELGIYGSYLDFTYTVGENPSGNYGAAAGVSSQQFRMYAQSGPLSLPHADPPYDEGFRAGITVIRQAFHPGDPEPHHSWAPRTPPEPGFLDWHEVNTDPALLAEVTGNGTLAMIGELTLSDITYYEPPDEEGMPPGWVYQPDMLEITPDLLHSWVWIKYHYTPEPSAFALLSLGLLLLRRRGN